MSCINQLLDRLWRDYITLNPRAKAVRDLLAARGERVVNDHIAIRTFADARLGIDVLAHPFRAAGYRASGEYEFPAKQLRARHYEHDDPDLPRVFISELRLEKFSRSLQQTVDGMIAQVPTNSTVQDDFCACGRPWSMSFATYQRLALESEYAAWVAAFGFRANHFTVLVNALEGFADLKALNEFIRQAGYELNTSGGEIKGSPEQWLEQSSTLAEHTTVDFTDGPHEIPACYYEFAQRYRQPDGQLFTGFIAGSADKIFESTDRR